MADNLQIPSLKLELPMALPGEGQPLLDESSRRLYEDANSAILKITTNKSRAGSGFLIDDGTRLITSARNVSGTSEQFAVAQDGKRYKLELEKMNDLADLAVLKIRDGKIPNTKPLTLTNSDEIAPDSKVWTISVPHESGSKRPYISPGYAQTLSSPYSLLQDLDPNINKVLMQKSRGLDPESRVAASAYFSQPLLQSKLHVETGSLGAPLLDEKANVVGITVLSNGKDLKSGQTLAVPVEAASKLLEGPGSFEFSYKAKAEDWAESYKQSWREDKPKALAETAATGFIAGFGYYAASRFPLVASAALAWHGLKNAGKDTSRLLNSTDRLDTIKYAAASASDLGTISGAALMLAPRYKTYGLALAGLGLAGRAASDFVENRWSVDETKRIDGGDPKRPPFNLDKFLGR